MQIEFQQAIEKHGQRVVTLARYSLRSAADADDIAQEVFVKLWQHWPRIDHDKQLP
jgi:DNA-directed RNA polymerase specialized sigma24 family protein